MGQAVANLSNDEALARKFGKAVTQWNCQIARVVHARLGPGFAMSQTPAGALTELRPQMNLS